MNIGVDHPAERLTARLDRLPASRFSYVLLLLLFPVWIFESYDIGLIGPTLPLLKPLWEPTAFEQSTLAIASTVAIAVGLPVSGLLVDKFGRRRVLILGISWFTGFTMLSAAAPNIWFLIATRALAGLGLGAVFPLPYVYLAEFLAPTMRAKFVDYLNGILTAAYVVPPLTAIFLTNQFAPETAWRSLYALSGVGLMYLTVLLKWLPESARWLAANGRVREAEGLVSRIEAQAVRSTGRPLPEPPVESAAANRPDVNIPWSTLFRPPQLKRTLVAWIMFFGTLPAFYALLTFAPTLMVEQGFALASSLGFAAALQLTGGVGGLIQGFLADAWGRKPLITLYAVLAAVGVALLAVGNSLPVLFTGGALLGFFGLGIFPVAKLYVAEQFPTPIRGLGTGSTEGFGRFFGGVVFVALVPYMSQLGGTDLVLWVVCGILLVASFLTVLVFGRETKGVSIDALPAPEEVATVVEASKTQH